LQRSIQAVAGPEHGICFLTTYFLPAKMHNDLQPPKVPYFLRYCTVGKPCLYFSENIGVFSLFLLVTDFRGKFMVAQKEIPVSDLVKRYWRRNRT